MHIHDLIDFFHENKQSLNDYPGFLDTASTILMKAKGSKSKYKNWEPHGDYTDKQKAEIDDLTGRNWSPREAEYLAGAHKGPKNIQDALKHTVHASMPSDNMLQHMKMLGNHFVDNADRNDRLNADINKNPVKYAAGKMMSAHDDHFKKYDQEHDEFINSGEFKGMGRFDKMRAVEDWKKKYKADNPEHNYSSSLSSTQSAHGEASEASKRNLQEQVDHIISGGQQAETFSDTAGAQMAGGVSQGEDSGFSTTVKTDPLAHFAKQNPKLVEHLREKHPPEVLDRYKSTISAKAAQSTKTDKPPTVIRRKKSE